MGGPDMGGLVDRLGAASLEAKGLLSELHTASKDARQARRELEQLVHHEVEAVVQKQVTKSLATALDELSERLGDFSFGIYERIGREIDKLIVMALGSEFSRGKDHEDLRPLLAARLRDWLRAQIDSGIVRGGDLLDLEVVDLEAACPHCRQPNNAILQVGGVVRKPRTGDRSVCGNCAGIAIWGLDRWHIPTDRQLADSLADPQLARAVDKVLLYKDRQAKLRDDQAPPAG